MSKILFISNGHGEDWISSKIIQSLLIKNTNSEVYVLPMVGEGRVFSDFKRITIIGPQKETSSGGFVKSLGSFIRDFFSGVFFCTF